MGSLFHLYCQDCGLILELRWGVGMIPRRPEDLPGMLPRKAGQKVRELMGQPDCRSVDYHRELFVCSRCGLPASRLNYSIEFVDGEVYQPSFRCSFCQGKLVPTEDLPAMDRCPRCGSRFISQGIGEWD
jgi:DNA-directed RNA polymerase subunit RPC12/RpoP